ncbi:hypothetical protein ECC02_008943 [Trypanosoma cruzi]|uniref:Uncharacterized protein n=1 Tax=Trypanosoma cruzi TaxID=5693 RepID=A0A7J6XVU7_TRYCR|nr:hypothetical protein ECC02_008943 [Trypanosoma cruzi]
MESTIFTETLSTAACDYAHSRRTVEAREHTSTVLDHLVTHIVDVPFFLASSTEERTHGCSLSLATAAYPGTKLVMHKPRRRPTSHSSQTHGAPASSHWPDVLLVSDSSGQELTAPLQQVTGTHAHGLHCHSQGGDCTSLPPHRCFSRIRMAATTTATRHPTHMPLVRRGCRTAGTQRTLHGKAISSRWTPHRHDPMPGRLPGVRQALQLPH